MSKDIEFKKFGISFYFYNQWRGVFNRSNNWYDFNWINIAHEWADYKRQFEIYIGLIGFNINIDIWQKQKEIV
jgi:hypothetical protein